MTFNKFILLILMAWQSPSFAFDQKHEAWGEVLSKYVVNEGSGTRMRYFDLAKNTSKLDEYLKDVSGVKKTEYDSWPNETKLAFLFNAYNAETIKLILDGLAKDPSLKSIKDLGTLFTNSWNIKFFKLLGEPSTLDHIEQDLARPEFDDPRMHMAFNCASIGCPALGHEPFVGERLDNQLDKAAKAFLADSTRNQIDAENSQLKLSSIFKWYGGDFKKSKRFGPLNRFLAEHMPVDAKQKDLILQDKMKLTFLDYDWKLNIKK